MGYSKYETIKKQRDLVSKTQRNHRKIWVNVFKFFLCFLVAFVVAGAGFFFGMMKGILDNAPDVDEINIVPKGFKTVIYDANGNVEKELATYNSNREYVYYEDIPEQYVNAFVAVEDERFWQHNGIDVKGILRAGVKGIISMANGGRMDEGASTLTQQLIKNQIYDVGMNEITFMDRLNRKIQEQYLAIELEKKYTKEEIVEYYLNTIYLGRGVHGIQAASERYFGKDMTELTVSEIAVIAGITQNPSAYDPVAFPEANAARREVVLKKMYEQGYITETQYNAALADDVYSRIQLEHEEQVANDNVNTYYEDAIINAAIKDIMEYYGVDEAEASVMLYTGGFSIYSVQDLEIQEICDSVINDPSYFSGVKVGLDYQLTISVNGKEKNYSTGHLLNYYADLTGNSKYNNIYANEDAARAAAEQFKEAKLDETGGTFIAETFVVSPQPQLAFTILDQHTGYVKAMVGGRGPKTANRGLNRATDSPRQPGSVFKICAAYLPYIDTGKGCLATCLKDERYTYANGSPVINWWGSGSYRGYCSVRTAIASSMNVLAVKAITAVGPDVAFDYLLDLGFTTLADDEVDPVTGAVLSDRTQSAALGGLSHGVTTFEMAGAFGCIANDGIYLKPVLYSKIVDHDGNVIVDNTNPETRSRRVIKDTTAWQLLQAMKSVINAGTGGAAKLSTGGVAAGKTGTTSSHFDLWFSGMTPYYTAAIWMGYDSNVDMGGSEIHKRMWSAIMSKIAVLEGHDPTLDWPKPDGITSITVCKITGKAPVEGCPTSSDYCSTDFSCGGVCSGHESIEICTESGKVATSQCPGKETYIVKENDNGEKEFDDAPSDILYTEEVCDLHPELSEEVYVTTSAGPGGSISPSCSVPRGSSATFYITPAEGYYIVDVVVNGQSVGPISSYTFDDMQDDASISVTFGQ